MAFFFLNQNSNFGLFFIIFHNNNVNTWNQLTLCSILGTADLVPHSLFAICGLVDEDAETMMGSVQFRNNSFTILFFFLSMYHYGWFPTRFSPGTDL